MVKKRRPRRGTAIPHAEKIAGFYNCMIRADLMRTLYERHARENPDLLGKPIDHPGVFGAYVLACFHMACLYEVIRAYRAIGNKDPAIEAHITPDLERILLNFRDVTFHFTSPVDPRLLALLGDKTRAVVRAYALHDEFRAFADYRLEPDGRGSSAKKPDA